MPMQVVQPQQVQFQQQPVVFQEQPQQQVITANSQPSSVVVTQQPKTEVYRSSFRYGLCDCCNGGCGLLCKTWWCHCCVLGDVGQKLGFSNWCMVYCCSWLMLAPSAAALTYYRGQLRGHEKIQADFVDDWCSSCFCPCCGIIQMAREVGL